MISLVPLFIRIFLTEFWEQTHDDELYRAYYQMLVDI